MNRSGYNDGGDCDTTEDFLRMCGWNANVKRCIAGRTGQAFMWELYQALEALPEHRLIQGALEDHGAYCSLGAVALARGQEIPAEMRGSDEEVDDYELAERYSAMGSFLGIKDMLAREIMYQNDDGDGVLHYIEGPPRRNHGEPVREETPEERWQRVRGWVVRRLKGIP